MIYGEKEREHVLKISEVKTLSRHRDHTDNEKVLTTFKISINIGR